MQLQLARRAPVRDERGATLVEFALVVPIFFGLVLGMFTFGFAHFERMSIADAVRDGSRFGATMEDFDTDAVKQRVVQVSAGTLSTADVCVAKVTVPDAGAACGVDDPTSSTGDEVVKVSASAPAEVEVIFFTRTVMLRSEAATVYER